jgi:hypothetical protein
MERQCVEEHHTTKAALINQFCSSIVASGLIIDPADINQAACYEIIYNQAKNKAQIYAFMRLFFANPNVSETDKRLFLKCI